MIDVIKKVVFFAGLLFALAAPAAYAENTFRIADIRIEGLQRVSSGSVFAALPVNTGDDIDISQLQDLTRTLFRTGILTTFKSIAITMCWLLKWWSALQWRKSVFPATKLLKQKT